ncbi:hypothetical protein BMS3Bbin02_00119 [bacterium BMS3Bbin02]|nr:hypothetical protein BMS3Bbin02_00119 [bacterium BMS3Bbin02]
MTHPDTHVTAAARSALGDIVTATPLAPEWTDLFPGPTTLQPNDRESFWRGPVIAFASAAIALVAVGSIAYFSSLGGTATAPSSAPGAIESPPPPTTEVLVPLERINLVNYITVSASSTLTDYPATNVLDGDPTTSWKSDPRNSDNVTLTFDFLQPVYLDTITVSYPAGEGPQDALGLPIEIEIQTEAGAEFLDVVDAEASGFYSIGIGSRHRGTLSITLIGEPQTSAFFRGEPRAVYAIADIEFWGSVVSEDPPEAGNTIPDLPEDIETVAQLQDLYATRESMISIIAARDELLSSLEQLVEQGQLPDSGVTPEELESRIAQMKETRASISDAEARLGEVTTAMDNLLELGLAQLQRAEPSENGADLQRVLTDLRSNLEHLQMLNEQLPKRRRFVDEARARNDTPSQIAALLDEVGTIQRGVTRFETKVAELFAELANQGSP